VVDDGRWVPDSNYLTVRHNKRADVNFADGILRAWITVLALIRSIRARIFKQNSEAYEKRNQHLFVAGGLLRLLEKRTGSSRD